MPVVYQIDEEKGIVRVRAFDEVTWEDQARASAAWFADPGYRPGMPILFDTRERRTVGDSEEVRTARDNTEALAAIQPGTRIAVVVQTDVGYGMTRMFMGLSGEGPLVTNVFRDIESAEAWLLASAE